MSTNLSSALSRWTLGSEFTTEEGLKLAETLEGKEVVQFADDLDTALDTQNLDDALQTSYMAVLSHLCGTHGILPSSHTITDAIEVTSKEPLFRGGFANVWKGSHEEKVIAIKEIRITGDDDIVKVKRVFSKEAVLWKRLSHANVLPFLGASTTLFPFCLISPWMENGSIMSFLKRNPNHNRMVLLVDIANGLKYLHSLDLVHGDLKGDNILITNECRACLADFGLMTIGPAPKINLTTTGLDVFMGTVRYMAPELLNPDYFGLTDFNPTKASDMYALAMVIRQVLTGKLPFHEYGKYKEHAILIQVVRGYRPDRPENSSEIGMTDPIWSLIEGCWNQDRNERMGISMALKILNTATRYWSSPMLPEELKEEPKAASNPLPVEGNGSTATLVGTEAFSFLNKSTSTLPISDASEITVQMASKVTATISGASASRQIYGQIGDLIPSCEVQHDFQLLKGRWVSLDHTNRQLTSDSKTLASELSAHAEALKRLMSAATGTYSIRVKRRLVANHIADGQVFKSKLENIRTKLASLSEGLGTFARELNLDVNKRIDPKPTLRPVRSRTHSFEMSSNSANTPSESLLSNSTSLWRGALISPSLTRNKMVTAVPDHDRDNVSSDSKKIKRKGFLGSRKVTPQPETPNARIQRLYDELLRNHDSGLSQAIAVFENLRKGLENAAAELEVWLESETPTVPEAPVLLRKYIESDTLFAGIVGALSRYASFSSVG